MSRLTGSVPPDALHPPEQVSPELAFHLGAVTAQLHNGPRPPGFGTWTEVDYTLQEDYANRINALHGLGVDYNEDLMEMVAESGRGQYYFVKDSAGLESVFAGELRSMQGTVATRAELRLTPACNGVEIAEVYGYESRREGGDTVVPLSDLFGGEKRKLIVRLRGPAAALGKKALVRTTLAPGRRARTLSMWTSSSSAVAAWTVGSVYVAPSPHTCRSSAARRAGSGSLHAAQYTSISSVTSVADICWRMSSVRFGAPTRSQLQRLRARHQLWILLPRIRAVHVQLDAIAVGIVEVDRLGNDVIARLDRESCGFQLGPRFDQFLDAIADLERDMQQPR
jgi:hypothetical protein